MKRIKIRLESRDITDKSEYILLVEDDVMTMEIDFTSGTEPKDSEKEETPENTSEENVVHDDVAEMKATSAAKEVLDKNEDDNLDQKPEQQVEKKKKGKKQLGKVMENVTAFLVRVGVKAFSES